MAKSSLDFVVECVFICILDSVLGFVLEGVDSADFMDSAVFVALVFVAFVALVDFVEVDFAESVFVDFVDCSLFFALSLCILPSKKNISRVA